MAIPMGGTGEGARSLPAGGTTHEPLTPPALSMRGGAWREVPCPGMMEENQEPHWPNGGVSWKGGSMH
ncbi:hypothetical protein MBOURGENBZM_17710 [Methanoculleus bourgensis]|nr:hypothetical protein MBOURGENBZM_17710 [Methanoculleus bourgensis]